MCYRGLFRQIRGREVFQMKALWNKLSTKRKSSETSFKKLSTWIMNTLDSKSFHFFNDNLKRMKLFIMAVNDFWQRNQINNHYSIWTLFIFQIWLIFVSQPSAQQQVLLSPLLGYHWLGDNNKLVDMPSLNSKCHHHKIFLANHFDEFFATMLGPVSHCHPEGHWLVWSQAVL